MDLYSGLKVFPCLLFNSFWQLLTLYLSFLITGGQGDSKLRELSPLSPAFLSWMVIADIEPIVEKYVLEATFLFFLKMLYITLLSTLIFAHYLISQALSILRFFGSFTVRLRFDREKKNPSDSQKCTTSVCAPFASSFTDLLNSSGLIKSPWVRALALLPQSFVS